MDLSVERCQGIRESSVFILCNEARLTCFSLPSVLRRKCNRKQAIEQDPNPISKTVLSSISGIDNWDLLATV